MNTESSSGVRCTAYTVPCKGITGYIHPVALWEWTPECGAKRIYHIYILPFSVIYNLTRLPRTHGVWHCPLFNSHVGGCLISSAFCLAESTLNTLLTSYSVQMNTHMHWMAIKRYSKHKRQLCQQYGECWETQHSALNYFGHFQAYNKKKWKKVIKYIVGVSLVLPISATPLSPQSRTRGVEVS